MTFNYYFRVSSDEGRCERYISMKNHNFFVYITTNPKKSVVYVGLTNDLMTRLQQHCTMKIVGIPKHGLEDTIATTSFGGKGINMLNML